VIGKVLDRGRRVGGLVRYLYGPGKAEEHRDPHIVASWTGETSTLEPTITARGRRDFRTLVGLLEAPLMAQAEWLRQDMPVYHVVARAAPEDRILSDAEWSAVATEMMHNVGLSKRDEAEAGVRWIAVRHADDHIHIVATLARQDGAIPRHSNDWYRSRETCRAFERRYGLRRTAPADRTAARRPHRAEIEKALRSGRRETCRDRLRRHVRLAAATAIDEQDFIARLKPAGVMVKLRYSKASPSEVTGYAVTLPESRAADGAFVWYGGGRLAADLTLPRLRQRWASGTARPADNKPAPEQRLSNDQRRRVLADAADHIAGAAEEVRRATSDGSWDAAAATVAAAADTAVATARVVEGRQGGRLTRAVGQLDRAAREPYGRVPRVQSRAEGLRSMARLIAAVRRLRPGDEALQAAELISRMAAFTDTVALLRRAQRRAHQAAAARIASAELRAIAASGAPDRDVSHLALARSSAVSVPRPHHGHGRSGPLSR
jgi:hypothetical protein